ncbi:MAG: hypothetical protein U0Q03_21530 [Acidimicrobiales bacterium]
MHEVHLPIGAATPRRTADDVVGEHRRAYERFRSELTVDLERRRRALERALHDGAQQQLLALRMAILRAFDPGSGAGPGRPDDDVRAALCEQLDGVIDDLRRLATGQRTRALDALDGGDFVGAIREHAAISGARTVVRSSATFELDDASAELCAFVVSEALANAREHANAATCTVYLDGGPDRLRLDVVDDGSGGAVVVPGRGIDGLSRRAGAMGGTLEILSDGDGTDVRLHLPLHGRPPAADPTGTGSSNGAERPTSISATLGRLAGGDVRVWFWCTGPHTVPARRALDGVWRDEEGVATVDPSQVDDVADVRVLVGGVPVAAVATSGDARAVAATCREHAATLLEGREHATAAPALARLRREHDRIVRRSASFDDALLRRLTDRPCDELVAARAVLTGGGSDCGPVAAAHVGAATELLREIVRRLRSPDEAPDPGGSLATRLRSVARRARVRIDVVADDLDGLGDVADGRRGEPGRGHGDDASDEPLIALVERVVEEVVLDAAPRSEVVVRIRARRRSVGVTVLLERLPSPVAVALAEELALAAGASLAVQPSPHGVRLVLEAPCAS